MVEAAEFGPVVVDATALDTGHRQRGIGRYVAGLVEGLGELRQRGELDLDVRLLGMRDLGAMANGLPTVPYPRWTRRSAWRLHLENRFRIDRFLPDDTALFHATSMDGMSRKRPWVATCHDLIPLVLEKKYLPRTALHQRWFWKEYVRLLREEAAHVIVISEHVKHSLVDGFGVDAGDVTVVHHGLSKSWSSPVEEELVPDYLRRATSERYVLFVGGFDVRKNFEGLVAALGTMPRPLRPRLLVAGARDAHMRRRHQSLLGDGALDVHFLDYVSDAELRFLYHGAVCLAFVSSEEGWGFPIAEAMAAGAPVVCARHGSMAEASAGAALETDETQPEEIARAILSLMQDESLRQAKIEAGRQRVRTLSWEQSARAVVDVYRRVLST